MAFNQAHDLWQQGKPLWSVLAEFDDSEEKAYNTAMQIAVSHPEDARNHLLKKAKDTPRRREFLETLDKMIQKHGKIPGIAQWGLALAPFFNQGRDAKDDIYGRIFSGDLVGYGYATPRKPDDLPARIPDDVWDGKVNWSASSVTGAGLKFVSVRLVDEKKAEALKLADVRKRIDEGATAFPIAAAKAGRKSRRGEILAAYKTLEAEGAVTKDTPKAILGHEIRTFILKHVSAEDRSETGLSDETIRRIIRGTK